jgi:SPP1 family predicted phage head-tail adaptor
MDLKQKITVQKLTKNPDGKGGYLEAWENYKTIFASVVQISQDIKEVKKKQALEVNLFVKVRAKACEIESTDRVLFQNRIFTITQIRTNQPNALTYIYLNNIS